MVPFTCNPPILQQSQIFPDANSSDPLHSTLDLALFPSILLLSKLKNMNKSLLCSVRDLKLWVQKGQSRRLTTLRKIRCIQEKSFAQLSKLKNSLNMSHELIREEPSVDAHIKGESIHHIKFHGNHHSLNH